MPLGGAFVEGCGDIVRRYATGDVGYHPPHESHWLHTHGNGTHGNGAHGFAVEVGPEWCTMFGDTIVWDAAPRDLSQSRISWLMGRLFFELRTHDAARPLAVQALGVEIGTELSRERVRHEYRRPRWLARVCELLRAQVGETPSLGQLAAVAGVTPAGMIKAFRRHEGCTPGEYLRGLRLAQARTALGATTRPLGAIALDAGFYDHSHFTREFRRALGVAPLGYRRAVRGL
jgi:AraC family transcriptional regulator